MCASQCRGVLRKEGMAQNFPGKCSKMSRSSSQTPATRAFPPCMAHDALSRCCGSRAQCRHLHRHVASSMAECLCSSMPPARLVAWCVAHSQTEPWRCVSAPACLVGECCAVSQSLSHQLPPIVSLRGLRLCFFRLSCARGKLVNCRSEPIGPPRPPAHRPHCPKHQPAAPYGIHFSRYNRRPGSCGVLCRDEHPWQCRSP